MCVVVGTRLGRLPGSLDSPKGSVRSSATPVQPRQDLRHVRAHTKYCVVLPVSFTPVAWCSYKRSLEPIEGCLKSPAWADSGCDAFFAEQNVGLRLLVIGTLALTAHPRGRCCSASCTTTFPPSATRWRQPRCVAALLCSPRSSHAVVSPGTPEHVGGAVGIVQAAPS